METTFTGFGEGAVDFFDGLAADNSRTYWQAHQDTYQQAVAGPLRALAEELAEEFGPTKVFRPYRDLRFSADKRPYQEHASLAAGSTDGVGTAYYLRLSPDGLFLAGGLYRPPRAALERFRRLQDDPATAADLDATLAELARRGFPLEEGAPVRTAPRGWSRDHPRIDLIRRTNLIVARAYEPEAWLHTPRCREVVVEGWRTVLLWNTWLDAHVGTAAGAAPDVSDPA